MKEIRMTGEVRTDCDCKSTGLPAERWAETVLKIGEEELVMEVSIEDKIIVAISAGGRRGLEGDPQGPQDAAKG